MAIKRYNINRRPKPIPMTQSGFDTVKADIERLLKERAEVLIRLQDAREMGDLSENGAYKAARWELGGIDRELRRLQHLAQYAEVRESAHTGVIDFGSVITMSSGDKKLTFMLVSGYESNPAEHKLSEISPFGKAVLGHKAGDEVVVVAPAGDIPYVIEKVE